MAASVELEATMTRCKLYAVCGVPVNSMGRRPARRRRAPTCSQSADRSRGDRSRTRDSGEHRARWEASALRTALREHTFELLSEAEAHAPEDAPDELRLLPMRAARGAASGGARSLRWRTARSMASRARSRRDRAESRGVVRRSFEANLVGKKASDDLERALKVRGSSFQVRMYTQLVSDAERRYGAYLSALEPGGLD